MSEIKDVDPDRHEAMSIEMDAALCDLVGMFVRKHNISGLSVITLALRGLVDCLAQLGGEASTVYLRCLYESATITNDREAKKLNDRARSAMKQMAEHYDAILARKIQ